MLRRTLLLATPAASAAPRGASMHLSIHQTTLAFAGWRASLEGIAKAGIRSVEIIPAHFEPFVQQEGAAAARRVLADLGLTAVSSGGVRGLVEPLAGNVKALEELKARAPLVRELGVDRMVCPCSAEGKFTLDHLKIAASQLQAAGDVARASGVILMLEAMRSSTLVNSLATALQLTRQVAHPNIRPMFDFYHFWAGLSKFEDLEQVREGELAHVHFQDVPTSVPRELLDNSTREIPGDGGAPLVKTLHALAGKGWRGPLSVELFYPRFQKGDSFEVCAEIRRKSETVMRQAGVL